MHDHFVNENGLCLKKEIIESVAAKIEDEPGVVTQFSETRKNQKAPLCFSLSALQKKSSQLLGYSAKQVLGVVQSLYETHKAVTYPRTDCDYLPTEQFTEASQVLTALEKVDASLQPLIKQCDTYFKSSLWNDKKITAHHAIIPTINNHVDIDKMSSAELNLYDLIRRYYIAQFLGDYEYRQRKVEIHCAGECFSAMGNTPLKAGWKNAFSANTLDEDDEENEPYLPLLYNGQCVENKETKILSKKTQPPARFTEGTLIEAMKTIGQSVSDEQLKKILKDSSGIGTEATRANILETLFKRDYLKRSKKHVFSTEKGRALIDLVPIAVKDPVLTAHWEQQLDKIANGQAELNHFVMQQSDLLKNMLHDLTKHKSEQNPSALQLQSDTQTSTVYLCPKCESPLRRLKNKKGNAFWGCSQYPCCSFTTWEKDNKPSL